MCIICLFLDILIILLFCSVFIIIIQIVGSFLKYICDFYNYRCRQKNKISSNKIVPQKKQNDICTICLENVFNSPMSCGHVFHHKCIVKWLKENNTCPNCRIDLV